MAKKNVSLCKLEMNFFLVTHTKRQNWTEAEFQAEADG